MRTLNRKERHPTDESRAIARVKREKFEQIFFVQGPILRHLGLEHAYGAVSIIVTKTKLGIQNQISSQILAPKLLQLVYLYPGAIL